MEAKTKQDALEELRKELGDIEMGVLTQRYTLADAIREGAGVTGQLFHGFEEENSNGYNVCALSAAVVAIRARGIWEDDTE